MAGYSRSFNKNPSDLIEAVNFNDEFTNVEAAFNNTAGHVHDGTIHNGAYVPKISDHDNMNEIAVDYVTNKITLSIEVGAVKTEQLQFIDGAIIPIVNNDIDLGSAAKKLKDVYIAGSLTVGTGTVSTIVDEDDMVSNSAVALASQQSIKAYVDSNITTSIDAHAHDGAAGNGSLISLIASPDGFNVVEVDDVTNTIIISTDVVSVKTAQLKVDGSAIFPALNLGLDLGKVTTNEFSNLYVSNGTIGTLNATSMQLSLTTSVNKILDEDDLISDDATALVTQQSVKKYADDLAALGQVQITENYGRINNVILQGTGSVVRTTVPATAKGVDGDKAGNIAADATHVYLCYTTWIDGTVVSVTTASAGVDYEIVVAGDTDFTLIGSSDNLPGTIFTATGPGTGTGTIKAVPDIWSRTAIATW